ncbi:SUMO1/sentrin/SMT3 specific peptidase 3, partial [Chelydra serpentina]
FQQEFSTPQRKGTVQQLIQSYQRMPGNAMVRGFRVNYKRHVLSMDDLQTLYGPNWLNDQVGRSARPPGGAALRGSGAGALPWRSVPAPKCPQRPARGPWVTS